MGHSNLLMLFVRHPELGKVKTRLAKEIGEAKALDIYIKLLQHTYTITSHLAADKRVCYAEEVQEHDLWDNHIFQKKAQPAGDLGCKMKHAFTAAFQDGYETVIIIGSDCLQLDQQIIEQAFEALNSYDVVIGPAKDGGYYLLGMKQLHPYLFENKEWSTAAVLPSTLADLKQNNLSYKLLPTLSDVDYASDVNASWLL